MTIAQIHTPSHTATKLFTDVMTNLLDQPDTAKRMEQNAYAHAKSTGGLDGELELRADMLRLRAPYYRQYVNRTIDGTTIAAFSPVVEATNRTLDKLLKAESGTTAWNGESSMRILCASIENFQQMIVDSGQNNRRCTTLGDTMSQIPLQLAVALSRGLSEAVPAIVRTMGRSDDAQVVVKGLPAAAQLTLAELMIAHQTLQSEDNQILEMEKWTGTDAAGSILLKCVKSVIHNLHVLNSISKQFAPNSNPQGDMMMQEADVRYQQLLSTLRSFCGH